MEEMDYLELPKQFPAVFHLICLVWSHSTHYQHPARIIVLLQEIANLLIFMVRWQTSELTLGCDDVFIMTQFASQCHEYVISVANQTQMKITDSWTPH